MGYIGFQAIRATRKEAQDISAGGQEVMTNVKAFRQGFMTNVLNPKATVFFLSLFTTIVSATTPVSILTFYGLWMAFATACWFTFLSFILGSKNVRQFFTRFGHWIDRVLGVFLIGLALLLVFATFG